MSAHIATVGAHRLTLVGSDPPRVAWVCDTTPPADPGEQGLGWIFANVEGERSHIAMLPGQAAIVITVDARDALELLAGLLPLLGPREGGKR
jgi:hypothetical protein